MRTAAWATALAFLLASLGGAPAQAAPDGPRSTPVIHIVGDSIPLGAGTSKPRRDSYPAVLARDGWRVHNRGIGATCLVTIACINPEPGTMVERVAKLPIRAGDTVLIAAGTNDLAAASPRQMRMGYRTVVRIVRAAGGRPIVATITPFGGDDLGQWRGFMDVTRISVNAWILATLPSVDLGSTMGGARLLPQYDSGDGLHPNNRGARALAAAVDEALTKVNP